ncbi:MAG: multicopper oxidase domain-containing protein [Clostridiales bacterium]|nr:multicopper oxidase domain-containing protein [Clostridiales bacterium]
MAHFEGFAGLYVWHCHILEHEDYEMMRPYKVVKWASKYDDKSRTTVESRTWTASHNRSR